MVKVNQKLIKVPQQKTDESDLGDYNNEGDKKER